MESCSPELGVLQQLSVASTVAEYFNLSNQQQFVDELRVVEDGAVARITQERTQVLAAALCRGLELYVISSKRSCSIRNAEKPRQDAPKHSSSISSMNQGLNISNCSSSSSSTSPIRPSNSASNSSATQINPVLCGQEDLLSALTGLEILFCNIIASARQAVTGAKTPRARAAATEAEHIMFSRSVFNSGLLPLLPQVWSCMAVHTSHQQQLLQQQLKKQRSRTAIQKAARPFLQLQEACRCLLMLWKSSSSLMFEIIDLLAVSEQPLSDSTAALWEAAVLSTQHLRCAAAAIAAIWRSDSTVLQCASPSAMRTRLVGLDSCWGVAELLAQAYVKTSPAAAAVAPSDTPGAAVDDPSSADSAGVDNLLWVLIVHATLRVAHQHDLQGGCSPVMLSSAAGRKHSSSASSSTPESLQSSITGSSSSTSNRQQATASEATAVQSRGELTLTVSAHHQSLLDFFGLAPMWQAMKATGKAQDGMHGGLRSTMVSLLMACGQCLDSARRVLLASAPRGAGLHTASSSSSSSSNRGHGSMGGSSAANSSSSSAAVHHGVSSRPAGASTQLLPLFANLLAEAAGLQPEQWALEASIRGFTFCNAVARRHDLSDLDRQLASFKPGGQSVFAVELPAGQAVAVAQYHACLQLLVPVHQHLSLQGSAAAAAEGPSLYSLLTDAMWKVMKAQGTVAVSPSQLVDASDCLPVDVMPAHLVFSSLEAAVRHASAVDPSCDARSLHAAALTVNAVSAAASTNMPQLLECASDVSKAPALLSLLLSCVKRVQHCSEYSDPAANCQLAGATFSIFQLAMRLIDASNSSGGGAGGDGGGSSRSSSGGASSSRDESSSRRSSRAPDTPGSQARAATSCWVVLLGRALYAAGAALQAAAGGTPARAEDNTTAGSAQQQQPLHLNDELLPVLSPAYIMTNAHIHLLSLYSTLADLSQPPPAAAAAAAAATGHKAGAGTHHKQLPSVLHVPAVKQRVEEAYDSLRHALAADGLAMGVLRDLRFARWKSAAAANGGRAAPDPEQSKEGRVQLWQQALGGQAGVQVSSSLLCFGSLLCGSLPSRYCCNEPSCCCFDRHSELQLAGGKGSQCSGCGAARYCGAGDQAKHWKAHKTACRALAAAAATPKVSKK